MSGMPLTMDINFHDIHVNHTRHAMGDLTPMQRTIEKDGGAFLTPLITWAPDKGRPEPWELIAGERRYAAAWRCGFRKAPMHIARNWAEVAAWHRVDGAEPQTCALEMTPLEKIQAAERMIRLVPNGRRDKALDCCAQWFGMSFEQMRHGIYLLRWTRDADSEELRQRGRELLKRVHAGEIKPQSAAHRYRTGPVATKAARVVASDQAALLESAIVTLDGVSSALDSFGTPSPDMSTESRRQYAAGLARSRRRLEQIIRTLRAGEDTTSS